MKVVFSLVGLLLLYSFAQAQSGRRAKEIKVPVPVPVQEVPAISAKEPVTDDSASSVTAERNQDYRCSDDGSLERLLDDGAAEGSAGAAKDPRERVLTVKETDSRAVITAKPQPSYSREARRNGIQGLVAVKVLLSGNGKISRVRVLKGLPAGLTENAIRAACKIKFKPALKDGEPVSQWVIAEYMFRLADSSIFRP